MKLTALLACVAAASAFGVTDNQEKLYDLMQLNSGECPKPLELTEEEMHYQLGEFSRNF